MFNESLVTSTQIVKRNRKALANNCLLRIKIRAIMTIMLIDKNNETGSVGLLVLGNIAMAIKLLAIGVMSKKCIKSCPGDLQGAGV